MKQQTIKPLVYGVFVHGFLRKLYGPGEFLRAVEYARSVDGRVIDLSRLRFPDDPPVGQDPGPRVA